MSSLYQPYGFTKMDAVIHGIWEFAPGVLLLCCLTCSSYKLKQKADTSANKTFLWDTVQGKIREAPCFVPADYQDLQIDLVGTPTLSMFRTFFFSKDRRVASPACFVQNRKEKVVLEEEWICDHTQHYRVDESKVDCILEGIYNDEEATNRMRLRVLTLTMRR
jgi:hypothetical protein